MKKDFTFWNSLLTHADAIADIDPVSADALEQLQAQLVTIDEAFGRSFDPADAFEEYVAVALCRSVQQTLARLEARNQKLKAPDDLARRQAR